MESKTEIQETVLGQFLKSVKKNIQTVGAETLGLSLEELDKVRDAIISGEPLYRILGMKESMIEARYALAHQLYTSGKYQDAETLFRWLTAYANDNEANWLGLGACRQALEKYDEAIEAYQMAALYSALEDPVPFYFSAICLLKQGRRDDAKVSLQTVLTLGNKENAEHKAVMHKAEAILFEIDKGE